ncbi:MAG: hypothetical protein WAM30_17190 [Candidatus Dormiibacterota bacterium]
MRPRAPMVLLIGAALAALVACSGSPSVPAKVRTSRPATTIVGLRGASLAHEAQRSGLSCTVQTLAGGGESDVCAGGDPTRDVHRVVITEPAPSTVSMVVASVWAGSGSVGQGDRAWLAAVVAAPYHGAQSRDAQRWLLAAEQGAQPARAVGGANLALTISRDRSVWTLTLVAPALPPDACPCHSQ